jgi:hypothetical protein
MANIQCNWEMELAGKKLNIWFRGVAATCNQSTVLITGNSWVEFELVFNFNFDIL